MLFSLFATILMSNSVKEIRLGFPNIQIFEADAVKDYSEINYTHNLDRAKIGVLDV